MKTVKMDQLVISFIFLRQMTTVINWHSYCICNDLHDLAPHHNYKAFQ